MEFKSLNKLKIKSFILLCDEHDSEDFRGSKMTENRQSGNLSTDLSTGKDDGLKRLNAS